MIKRDLKVSDLQAIPCKAIAVKYEKTWRVNKLLLLLLMWLSKESIRLKHHRSPVLFSREVM